MQRKPPKRWSSSRVCPACGSRAAKVFHISAEDSPYECQICKHRYNPPPSKSETVTTRRALATDVERIKYKREFGKRWDDRLPRNSIRYLVSRMPCWTDDDTVAETVLIRCQASKIPESMFNACKRYALLVHAKQKDLYYSVLHGDMR